MLDMNFQNMKANHPMDIISTIVKALQEVFTDCADQLAQETQFIKRQRKITGSGFVQAMVFGWLAQSDARVSDLSQSVANVKIDITRQALHERFTPEAAAFLEAMLHKCIAQVVTSLPIEMPLLGRFDGIYVMDSTIIILPDELSDIWQGCEGSALKLSVCWELLSGQLQSVYLHDGLEHDQQAPMHNGQIPSNCVRLSDLGYFKLACLEQHHDEGAVWVTRYKVGTVVCDEDGKRLDILDLLSTSDEEIVDQEIRLGDKHQIPCRLIAQRIPQDKLLQRQEQLRRWESRKQKQASPQKWALLAWTIYVTNASAEQLSAKEVMLMARVRWQIELLFKLWKDSIDIDDWRSEKPYRILCEVYAKMMACIVQHWLLLVGGIHALDKSMTQATTPIRNYAWTLARDLRHPTLLARTIEHIRWILTRQARINSSLSSPSTYSRIVQQTA